METMVCWATAETAVIEMACSLIMESIFGRGPSVIKTSVHQAHAYKHTRTIREAQIQLITFIVHVVFAMGLITAIVIRRY